MTTEDAVKRARSSTLKNYKAIKYGLGRGGTNPNAPHPDDDGLCDCSGFTSWCLGLSRQVSLDKGFDFGEEWINTDAIYADALSSHKAFQKAIAPMTGDLIVYGKNAHESYGHVGIITEVANGEPATVAHCCARGGLLSAIIEEPYSVFWKKAKADPIRKTIFARYSHYDLGDVDKMKPVTIIINGVLKADGLYDAAKGITYVEIKDEHPTAKYEWDPPMEKLTVTIPNA